MGLKRAVTRFLVIGDLHGVIPKLHFKDFDAIIAPGDFCSDEYKPLIFKILQRAIRGEEIYWYSHLSQKRIDAYIQRSLRNGRKLLEFLNNQNVPVFLVPGNWDYAKVSKFTEPHPKNRFPKLLEGLENLHDIHGKKKTFQGIDLIGYGNCSFPEIPQYAEDKKRYSQRELQKIKEKFQKDLKKYDVLFAKAKNPTIFLSHNVPFNTSLDKITWKESPRYGKHFGSVLARKIVEKQQPLVCVGAHMHEHFGTDMIKKTVCMNAGFGAKVNTLLEITDGKIRRLTFYPKKY